MVSRSTSKMTAPQVKLSFVSNEIIGKEHFIKSPIFTNGYFTIKDGHFYTACVNQEHCVLIGIPLNFYHISDEALIHFKKIAMGESPALMSFHCTLEKNPIVTSDNLFKIGLVDTTYILNQPGFVPSPLISNQLVKISPSGTQGVVLLGDKAVLMEWPSGLLQPSIVTCHSPLIPMQQVLI